MRKHLLLLLLLSGISLATFHQTSQAQSIELVAGNTLNGAMNGVLLGGATMALQNSNDFEPVRTGLGAGVLFGIGVGIHDVSQIEKGQQFYISGTFNDGTNSSILVLLDTIYGAAGGALVASSVSLIIKEPLVEALQYGSGAGAWLGFAFGLADAFVLSKGPDFSSQSAHAASSSKVSGFLTYRNASNSLQVGMFSPDFIKQKKISKTSLKTVYQPSLNIVQLSIDF